MTDRQFIRVWKFYDKLDEKYGHDNNRGQLVTRKTNRFVVPESLRSQIKGQIQSVPAPSFVWWLRTGEIPERVVKAVDDNRWNLKFDNLKPFKTTGERFNERRAVWLEWCHSSEEERR